ncbi:MAG: polysaccharide deacetylase family protein [Chitinophagaceae bacterium]|nr:polysaccharide deacetylase family protein [Chitinophagaceae bacterium]MCW5905958.1 polysaccharide deacetylase family protein [Chitinophagaceae bacterium]
MIPLFSRFFILIMIASSLFTSCKNSNNNQVNEDSLKNVQTKPTPGTPIQYDSSKRYIFLTWDDAPQPPGSNICKRIFEEQGVKATFFMVGMHQIDNRRKHFVDTIRNAYPQFLLANHSYSHGFQNKYSSFYAKPDSAVKDFLHAEQVLNIPVKIIRFPGNPTWASKGQIKGTKATIPVAKILDSLGYHIIGWDVEWEFVGGNKPKQTAEQMIAKVNQLFDNGNTYEPNCIVILAHDRMFSTTAHAAELEKFIAELKKDTRNVFETIDHYPSVQNK